MTSMKALTETADILIYCVSLLRMLIVEWINSHQKKRRKRLKVCSKKRLKGKSTNTKTCKTHKSVHIFIYTYTYIFIYAYTHANRQTHAHTLNTIQHNIKFKYAEKHTILEISIALDHAGNLH